MNTEARFHVVERANKLAHELNIVDQEGVVPDLIAFPKNKQEALAVLRCAQILSAMQPVDSATNPHTH